MAARRNRNASRGYDATNTRDARDAYGSQVIEAELIDDDAEPEIRPVDDFAAQAARVAGVGRAFIDEIAQARAWAGTGAVGTAPSNITLSFGAAAGVAAGVALIGGLAGWYLRGAAGRKRRRIR